ncbi:MAG: valine--tRNA ligase, partial [Bacteroidia bacterium]|nr:valine--tRNA ligase [Bacteroidia bacterium]
QTLNSKLFLTWESVLRKLIPTSEISFVSEPPNHSVGILVRTHQFFYVTNSTDSEKEKTEILKEIEYLEGFLKSVESKLNNEKFITNAKPELVERERKKQEDAKLKIETLKNRLLSLSN